VYQSHPRLSLRIHLCDVQPQEAPNPFGPLHPQTRVPYVAGASSLLKALSIGPTGSHVPHKSLDQVHAIFMPDATQAVNRLPLDLS
jgi:hypothetical protein